MENPAANSPGESGGHRGGQRRIELRHAAIAVDGEALRRTAEFTDGSTGTVKLEWRGITRVVALKCGEPRGGVCVIVTGGGVVVVLDEGMDGFQAMVNALPARLAGAQQAAEWRQRVTEREAEANVTWVFGRLAE